MLSLCLMENGFSRKLPSSHNGVKPLIQGAMKLVNNYLQALKSSKESLREQLEKAKKKEAAFIVTFAKREQEIAELKAILQKLPQLARRRFKICWVYAFY